MKRTELKRKSGMAGPGTLKRSSRRDTVRQRERVGGFKREDFVKEGLRQGVCAVTGRKSGWNGRGQEPQPYQNHHAVYEQHVAARGGDIWDPRNCLRLSTWAHKRHHDGTDWKVPMRCLKDTNIEFAFELLGAGAYDYLKRRYAGHDERVELALGELENPDAAA